MTTSSVNHVAAATTITGNQITIKGNTITAPHTAGNTSGQPISTIAFKLTAIGAIHGFVMLPFADPDTFEGALMPADLQSAEISLTQGGADAALELLAQELYSY